MQDRCEVNSRELPVLQRPKKQALSKNGAQIFKLLCVFLPNNCNIQNVLPVSCKTRCQKAPMS